MTPNYVINNWQILTFMKDYNYVSSDKEYIKLKDLHNEMEIWGIKKNIKIMGKNTMAKYLRLNGIVVLTGSGSNVLVEKKNDPGDLADETKTFNISNLSENNDHKLLEHKLNINTNTNTLDILTVIPTTNQAMSPTIPINLAAQTINQNNPTINQNNPTINQNNPTINQNNPIIYQNITILYQYNPIEKNLILSENKTIETINQSNDLNLLTLNRYQIDKIIGDILNLYNRSIIIFITLLLSGGIIFKKYATYNRSDHYINVVKGSYVITIRLLYSVYSEWLDNEKRIYEVDGTKLILVKFYQFTESFKLINQSFPNIFIKKPNSYIIDKHGKVRRPDSYTLPSEFAYNYK